MYMYILIDSARRWGDAKTFSYVLYVLFEHTIDKSLTVKTSTPIYMKGRYRSNLIKLLKERARYECYTIDWVFWGTYLI